MIASIKYYLFIALFVLRAGFVHGQHPTSISGYVVTNNYDTVVAQIKLPHYTWSKKVMLVKFNEKVEIIDSSNKRVVYRVNDIKGFGFSYLDNKYQFLAKDFGRENAFSASTHRFYQAVYLGPKCNFYHGITNVDVNDRIIGSTYFVEKSTGENSAIYLFARTKPDFIQTLLKKFFKDDAGIHPLIDSKFQGEIFETWPNDILEIVQAANDK